ncbi:LexA family protein [Coprococcus aceti]|uniref:LexA family protein n=1 Tax=Coprococcus aceti TaxID=2981786 RepID=UPI0022DFCDEC|nr:XRE family transcriptional regulator [Coprococcus aceti]
MLGDNIKYLRLKQGLTQDFIADKLGYKSYTTIQKWESGVSEPPVKKLRELASIFNIDMDDLASKDLKNENNNDSEQKRLGKTINVLGRVAAGIPINAITEIIDTEEISEDMAKTGDFFALQIKGDSMEPRIYDGDVVIVRQQEDADSGDIVIAMVNGYDATCKRLVKYATSIALVSLNSKYEPMMFTMDEVETKPVRIIGKVVELRGKF